MNNGRAGEALAGMIARRGAAHKGQRSLLSDQRCEKCLPLPPTNAAPQGNKAGTASSGSGLRAAHSDVGLTASHSSSVGLPNNPAVAAPKEKIVDLPASNYIPPI